MPIELTEKLSDAIERKLEIYCQPENWSDLKVCAAIIQISPEFLLVGTVLEQANQELIAHLSQLQKDGSPTMQRTDGRVDENRLPECADEIKLAIRETLGSVRGSEKNWQKFVALAETAGDPPCKLLAVMLCRHLDPYVQDVLSFTEREA